MVPARVNQRYTIRFALAAPNASARDVGKLKKKKEKFKNRNTRLTSSG